MAGDTNSANFPTTSGAVQTPPIFCSDVGCYGFLSRLNPVGGGANDLVYSTYVGAFGAASDIRSVAVNPLNGDAVVAGDTAGTNFPTKDPIQKTCGCFTSSDQYASDAFVTEIQADPAGTADANLAFSTFVGGTGFDEAQSVAVDSSGSVYITGETSGTGPTGVHAFPPLPFPTTPGAFQPAFAGGATNTNYPLDAFVTKIAFADLGVSASAAPSPATVRQPLTYTVTASNAGPSPVSAVVTDVLPKGLTFASGSPGCTVSKGKTHVVTCLLGDIASGASAQVTITVTPKGKGTFSNTVSVDGNAPDSRRETTSLPCRRWSGDRRVRGLGIGRRRYTCLRSGLQWRGVTVLVSAAGVGGVAVLSRSTSNPSVSASSTVTQAARGSTTAAAAELRAQREPEPR